MNDEIQIIFRGPGPFHLPVAQRARVDALKNNGVDATFYVLVPERDPDLEAVSIQMTARLAREFAAQLLVAADKSEPD